LSKRLVVLSMIGGVDLIGELLEIPVARLERPCVIQRQANKPANITLFDILKGGIVAGDSIEVNLQAVLWLAEPSLQVANAYRSLRSMIIIPGAGEPKTLTQ
jgi:hypothetical protein